MTGERPLPVCGIDRARTAERFTHERASVVEGAEMPAQGSPLVDVVAHGNGMIGAYRLAGRPGILVLRAAALRTQVNVVGAAIAVNGTFKGSAIAPEISDVTFIIRVRRPKVNTGGVPTAAQLAAVITYGPDRSRIPASADQRIGNTRCPGAFKVAAGGAWRIGRRAAAGIIGEPVITIMVAGCSSGFRLLRYTQYQR